MKPVRLVDIKESHSKSQRTKAQESGLFQFAQSSLASVAVCFSFLVSGFWNYVFVSNTNIINGTIFFFLKLCLLSTAGSVRVGPKLFPTNTIPTAVFEWLELHREPLTDWTVIITSVPIAFLIGKTHFFKKCVISNNVELICISITSRSRNIEIICISITSRSNNLGIVLSLCHYVLSPSWNLDILARNLFSTFSCRQLWLHKHAVNCWFVVQSQLSSPTPPRLKTPLRRPLFFWALYREDGVAQKLQAVLSLLWVSPKAASCCSLIRAASFFSVQRNVKCIWYHRWTNHYTSYLALLVGARVFSWGDWDSAKIPDFTLDTKSNFAPLQLEELELSLIHWLIDNTFKSDQDWNFSSITAATQKRQI